MSFASQMGSAFGSKFSHSFSPFGTNPNIPSKISFGSGSEVLGDGVVSTPLIQRGGTTLYFVTLKGISVGDKYLLYAFGFRNSVCQKIFMTAWRQK